MYCDRCGSAMQDRQQFCGSCGKPAAPAPGPARRGRVAENLNILAILWMVYSAVHLAGGVFSGAWLAGRLPGPWWAHPAGMGWPPGHALAHGAMFPLLGGISLLSVLGIVVGAGLMARKAWARTWAIVFGCLALFNFPLGTALGMYTLWVLGSAESRREYGAAMS